MPLLDSDHDSPDHVESLLDAKPFILTLDHAREHTLRWRCDHGAYLVTTKSKSCRPPRSVHCRFPRFWGFSPFKIGHWIEESPSEKSTSMPMAWGVSSKFNAKERKAAEEHRRRATHLAKRGIMFMKEKGEATILRVLAAALGVLLVAGGGTLAAGRSPALMPAGISGAADPGTFRLPDCTGRKRQTLHRAIPPVYDRSRRRGSEGYTHEQRNGFFRRSPIHSVQR